MSCPAGKVGQECLCGHTTVLPQCRMPKSTKVKKTKHAFH